MCTLSWLHRPDGYAVFFNRDERRTRLPALPPRLESADGVLYVAPRDADAGGTWILVNEHGVTVALLNRFVAPPDPSRAFVSRGVLVRSLAGSRSVAEIESALDGRALDDFQPFTLAAFDRGSGPLVVEWDGRERSTRRLSPAEVPLTSSGYDAGGVARHRRATLEALAAGRPLDEMLLVAFHRSHLPQRGPWSPCMHRDEAATVSLTRIDVAPDRIRCAYHAGPPCETAPDSIVEIPFP